MDKVISVVQWNEADIRELLKENGYQGTDKEIERFLERLDVLHFEEKCIQYGWELLQSEIRSLEY